MSAFQPWDRPMFKGDLPSRAREKQRRNAEALAAWKAVCKQVDARDKGRCRACGKRCDPNAVTLLDKAHRHHIVYRSAGGEDLDINVLTLCAICHADQHAGRIDIRGTGLACELWKLDEHGEWFLVAREQMPFVHERD